MSEAFGGRSAPRLRSSFTRSCAFGSSFLCIFGLFGRRLPKCLMALQARHSCRPGTRLDAHDEEVVFSYSALPPEWLSPPPCAGELAGQDAPCRSQALAPPTVCAPCLALLALSGHDRVWASLATARELDGHDVVGRSPPPAPPSFSALMPASPAGLSTMYLYVLLRVFVRLMYCCLCTEVFDCGRTHP